MHKIHGARRTVFDVKYTIVQLLPLLILNLIEGAFVINAADCLFELTFVIVVWGSVSAIVGAHN